MIKQTLVFLFPFLLFFPVDSLNHENIAISSIKHQPKTLSLLSFNIWFDSDDWPARFEHMLKEIHEYNPDIIGLQEVIQRTDLDNQEQQLAESLGYEYYFDSVDAEGQDKRFGNAILS